MLCFCLLINAFWNIYVFQLYWNFTFCLVHPQNFMFNKSTACHDCKLFSLGQVCIFHLFQKWFYSQKSVAIWNTKMWGLCCHGRGIESRPCSHCDKQQSVESVNVDPPQGGSMKRFFPETIWVHWLALWPCGLRRLTMSWPFNGPCFCSLSACRLYRVWMMQNVPLASFTECVFIRIAKINRDAV